MDRCKKMAGDYSLSKNKSIKKNREWWAASRQIVLKINMNMSIFSGAKIFYVGMVLRNQLGSIVAGNNLCWVHLCR